jgi:hypothetical protein
MRLNWVESSIYFDNFGLLYIVYLIHNFSLSLNTNESNPIKNRSKNDVKI